MGGIESFIVLPVAAFHLSIVPGSKWPDDFMADPMHFQVFLEESGLFPVRGKAVGKFRPIVCLDTFNRAGEGFYQMFHKLSGRIGAVFLKRFHKTPSGILIDRCVLKELFSDDLAVFQTGGGDKFHIHLEALTGIVHRFIGLRDILWIRRMYSHDPLFFKEAVKARDGAGIAALPELNPEDDETSMGVSAAHIEDQLDFGIGMLVGVVKRAAGTVPQGVPGAVITAFPAIDILSVGLVFDSSLRNAIFICIFEQG